MGLVNRIIHREIIHSGITSIFEAIIGTYTDSIPQLRSTDSPICWNLPNFFAVYNPPLVYDEGMYEIPIPDTFKKYQIGKKGTVMGPTVIPGTWAKKPPQHCHFIQAPSARRPTGRAVSCAREPAPYRPVEVPSPRGERSNSPRG